MRTVLTLIEFGFCATEERADLYRFLTVCLVGMEIKKLCISVALNTLIYINIGDIQKEQSSAISRLCMPLLHQFDEGSDEGLSTR